MLILWDSDLRTFSSFYFTNVDFTTSDFLMFVFPCSPSELQIVGGTWTRRKRDRRWHCQLWNGWWRRHLHALLDWNHYWSSQCNWILFSLPLDVVCVLKILVDEKLHLFAHSNRNFIWKYDLCFWCTVELVLLLTIRKRVVLDLLNNLAWRMACFRNLEIFKLPSF